MAKIVHIPMELIRYSGHADRRWLKFSRKKVECVNHVSHLKNYVTLSEVKELTFVL